MIGDVTNPQGESRFLVQEECTANDAQGRSNGAKVGVVDVAKERNFLTIFFAFSNEMQMEEMLDNSVSVMLWMGISLSRKNSKSLQ